MASQDPCPETRGSVQHVLRLSTKWCAEVVKHLVRPHTTQIDRADEMLTGLRDRIREGRGMPEPAWPDTDGQHVIALARRDPDSRMITLLMDETSANIAVHAITAHAGDREAHVREVEQYGQSLREDSYGRRNRQAIAASETRVAARLRAVEHAYRTATDPDAAPEADRTRAPRSAAMAAERELELG